MSRKAHITIYELISENYATNMIHEHVWCSEKMMKRVIANMLSTSNNSNSNLLFWFYASTKQLIKTFQCNFIVLWEFIILFFISSYNV